MSDDLDKRLAALEATATAIRDHIEAIRRSISTLDEALQRFKSIPVLWPGYPAPLPMAGCVCPTGAEISCGVWNCPRRTQVVATASDTLPTTAIGAIPRNGSGVCKTCPPDWCGAGSESFCPERDDGRVTP